MIRPQLLGRARTALRVVRQLQLAPGAWAIIEHLAEELVHAVQGRDEPRLREVLAELERAGSTRAGPIDVPNLDLEGSVVAYPGIEAPGSIVARLRTLDMVLESATAEIRRFPHIELGEKTPLRPGARFTANVVLDTASPRPDERADVFILRNPPADLRELAIEVWLTTSAHFVIEGSSLGTVILRPNEERSTVAAFTLVVQDPLPADAGVPTLHATFNYKLRASGSVYREIPLAGGDDTPGAHAQPTEVRDAEAGEVIVAGRAQPPDLEVIIRRVPDQPRQYFVLLRTSLLGGVAIEDTWTLEDDAEALVKRFMSSFIDPLASRRGRRRSLEGAGVLFFGAAPPAFRELYWQLVDGGTPPRSMLLISDERAIPWELMIPRRRGKDGSWQTMEPLGISCAIGRWHQDEMLAPSQCLPLSDSLILAPDYPAPYTLAQATHERNAVRGRFPGPDVPGTFDALDLFYSSHSGSLLHFICHGRDATLQSILLLEDESLSALQVLTSGLADACRARRPLVFLNACEVGRPAPGLASVGGFPASFIASDAGAVIAPLWSVEDDIAHEVSTRFYRAVERDPARPFADILRGLRAQAYTADGADSYAAYCFYGDPLASGNPS
jgi:CHAT domain